MSLTSRERVPALICLIAIVALGLQLGGFFDRNAARGVAVATELYSEGDLVPEVQLSRVNMSASGAPGEPDEPVLLSDLAGDACAVVFFFDPVCPACSTAAPQWSAESPRPASVNADDVFFVAVTANTQSARDFMTYFDVPYPLLQVTDFARRGELGIPGYPTLWVVRDGSIRRAHSGAALTVPDAVDATFCEGAATPSGERPRLP